MSTNRRIVCSSTPASLRGSTRAVGCCSGSPGPRVPPWSSYSCSSRAREGSADVLRGRRTSPGARRRRTRVWMHDLRFPHSAPHGEALHPVRPVSWPPEYGCAVGAAHGRSRPDADQRPTGSGRPVERRLHGPSRPGSSTTTLDDATQPSEAIPRSAGCNQPHDRVQLICSAFLSRGMARRRRGLFLDGASCFVIWLVGERVFDARSV